MSYHYKNQELHKKTADFIENVFSNFLEGITSNTDINLQEFMELSDTHYQNWLHRAVTEIIYWTKIEYSASTSEDKLENSAIDVNDFAFNHIENNN